MVPPPPNNHDSPSKSMPPPLQSMPFFGINKDDDCDRPACEETQSALSAAFRRVRQRQSNVKNANEMVECPPNKDFIGSSSWTLLHSMAAWYPDQPSPTDRDKMKNLFDAIAAFYPCTYCAQDFRIELKKSPVRTQSREQLSLWLCEQHNKVNEKIGKPLFQCDINVLDERWRKSRHASCNDSGGEDEVAISKKKKGT